MMAMEMMGASSPFSRARSPNYMRASSLEMMEETEERICSVALEGEDKDEGYNTPKLEILHHISRIKINTGSPSLNSHISAVDISPPPIHTFHHTPSPPPLSTHTTTTYVSQHHLDFTMDFQTQEKKRDDLFKKSNKHIGQKLHKFLRQSHHGKCRLKRPKIRRIQASCHVISDELDGKSSRPFIGMQLCRDSPRANQTVRATSCLCDTGASHSVLPLSYALEMGIHIDKSIPSFIKTASEQRI